MQLETWRFPSLERISVKFCLLPDLSSNQTAVRLLF
jgi:hypothetical protein